MTFITVKTISISNFITILNTKKQKQFSGKFLVKNKLGEEWVLYLFLGRILYATGGKHPVRRWQRNLNIYCPNLDLYQLKKIANNRTSFCAGLNISWEYYLLCLGVEQQQIMREEAAKIINATVAEVLFDVTQAMEVSCELKPENLSAPQLVLLDPTQVITEVQQVWQTWQRNQIADRSPNRAPVIREPEQLQQQTSAAVYQNLVKLLDGQRSLRDIATLMKRDVLQVVCSLLPYIQSRWVELIEIPDLALPIDIPTSAATATGPLIACIDDSPLVCQSMEKILTTAGYKFLAIQDSLRAIATLLTNKPDLVFLDLIMPNTNGYEICSQLRKVSAFHHIPIIILTGNDGIIDRVRAKLVGSSGFISKPAEPKNGTGNTTATSTSGSNTNSQFTITPSANATLTQFAITKARFALRFGDLERVVDMRENWYK